MTGPYCSWNRCNHRANVTMPMPGPPPGGTTDRPVEKWLMFRRFFPFGFAATPNFSRCFKVLSAIRLSVCPRPLGTSAAFLLF